MTPEEFCAKIDFEGGVFDALEYGLTEEGLGDPVLAAAWKRLREKHQDMRADVVLVESAVEQHWGM